MMSAWTYCLWCPFRWQHIDFSRKKRKTRHRSSYATTSSGKFRAPSGRFRAPSGKFRTPSSKFCGQRTAQGSPRTPKGIPGEPKGQNRVHKIYIPWKIHKDTQSQLIRRELHQGTIETEIGFCQTSGSWPINTKSSHFFTKTHDFVSWSVWSLCL